MSSRDYELGPRDMPLVRLNLFSFLTQPERAATIWTAELAKGTPIFAPPESADVPAAELGAWLAAGQATIAARARHFWLDPPAGDLAIQAGASMSLHNGVTVTKPPRPFGLLLCPNGLGYSSDGFTVIAALWGPDAGGYWITWWADSREYLDWVATADPPAASDKLFRWMGNLHYITGGHAWFTDPTNDQVADNHPVVNVTTQPHPNLPGPTGTLEGCFRATVGAWWLFNNHKLDIERITPDAADTAREQERGVLPSKITRGYLVGTVDAARVWDYGAGPV